MALAATLAYIIMMLFFILKFIVDLKTNPVQIQEFNTSSVPSVKNSTDVYSLTTMNSTGAGKNSHLNMSNYEEVTHNPPGVESSTLTPSLITLPIGANVSNTSSAPPDEKSTTFVIPSTMMLTTTDSIDIKNGPHNISNNEEVTHNPPGVESSTLTPSLITLPVEAHVSNTSSAPPDEKSTTFVIPSTMMLTTTDSIDIKNGPHNISNNEEVTHNPPGVEGSTLTPSLITLPVEAHVSNTSSAPPDEKSTTFVIPLTMMLTTTDSIDIKNGPHNISNNEEVTHNPPSVEGSTFIPSWFKLPVEALVSNNTSGSPLKENTTDVTPSTMMLTTTDCIDIENGPQSTSGPSTEVDSTDIDSSLTTISTLNPVEDSENVPLVEPMDAEGDNVDDGLYLVPHNLSALDDSNINSRMYTLNVNISGESSTENSTDILYPSGIFLKTTADFDDTVDTEYDTFNMSDYKDVCGRQLIPMSRIVGGNNTSFGEWPWQISLRHKKKKVHKCGAVLLNENWAITAVHCTINVSVNDIHLVLGKYDFSGKDQPYDFQIRKLQTVIKHPKYNRYTMKHDLALLRFDEPVKFQPHILPVCLPEDDSNFAGYSAHITGWGTLFYDGALPTVLQRATVTVPSNSVCEDMYREAGYRKKIPDTLICAGSKNGGYDACKGDSGGPMVVQRPDNRWVVAGITSWGLRCGEPNSPGMYMRVSKYRDWINKIIFQS